MNPYLESAQAVHDYAALALQARGNQETFDSLWRQNLTDNAVELAVNENDVLPTKIIGEIQTAIDSDQVFSKFKLTFNVEAGTLWIEEENTVGAKGHKKLSSKTEQQTTLIQRVLIPEAIYKLQRLDHMTYLKGGALIEWVLKELPLYVIRRISQAILVGGVKNEDSSEFTQIHAIIGDTLAQDVSVPAAATGSDLAAAIVNAVATTRGTNKVIFINPAAYAKLLLDQSLAIGVMAGMVNFGANDLVSTDLLPDANPFIVVDVDSYLLGFAGQGVETLAAFEIMSNSQVIKSRAYVMGSLTRSKAATVATLATE